MKSIVEINYNELRQFEESVEANVKVGGYGMDKISPIEEGKCYRIILKAEDINRIFLLKEPTFTNFTINRNFMIADVTEKVDEVERVRYWLDRGLDLRNAPEWAPVFVSRNIENGSFTIIDANHRMTAHYRQHKIVDEVAAYVFTHSNINQWWGIPDLAK
jgi:hypothetical protein